MSQGNHTYQEIHSQGESWMATLDGVKSTPDGLIKWLRRSWAESIFIGCGSTYYLSLSAAAIWQSLTGQLVRAVPASELWLFPEASLHNQNAMLVAISRSGETTETLRAVTKFQQEIGEDVLAISCYEDRELVQHSHYALITKGADEKSVAQTRSFTSMFLLSQYIAGIAANDNEFLNQVGSVPVNFDRLITDYEPMMKTLGDKDDLDHFVFLGSGSNYGLACEAMLKMKEVSLSVAEAFHFMEFRHGPKSMVTPRTLVIGLISDNARQYELAVLNEMHALGATLLVLDDTDPGLKTDYVVEFHSGLRSITRGSLFLPALQLLAYYRSIRKGLNPDQPKNLDAVVRI